MLKDVDGFTAIAEPSRRRILDRLRIGECDVSGLVGELEMSQPLVSKHLRVLRELGVVTADVDGRRRVYRLAAQPLSDVLDWVTPYRQMWAASFDRLAEEMAKESSG